MNRMLIRRYDQQRLSPLVSTRNDEGPIADDTETAMSCGFASGWVLRMLRLRTQLLADELARPFTASDSALRMLASMEAHTSSSGSIRLNS